MGTATQTGNAAEERARDNAMQAAKEDAAESRVSRYMAQETLDAIDDIDQAVAEHADETRELFDALTETGTDEPLVSTGQGDQRKTYNGETAPRAATVGIPLGLLVIVCVGWLVYWVLFSGAV